MNKKKLSKDHPHISFVNVSFVLLFSTAGYAFKSVHRNKHIVYNSSNNTSRAAQELNVFAPAKKNSVIMYCRVKNRCP